MSLNPTPQSRFSLPDASIILVMLVSAAVVLAPHVGRSAYYDEAWVIDAATAPTVSEGWATLIRDTQPAAAGYTAMLHGSAQLITPSLGLFRSPEAFFGVAAVLLA